MMSAFDPSYRLNCVSHISAVLLISSKGEMIAPDIFMNLFCGAVLWPI